MKLLRSLLLTSAVAVLHAPPAYAAEEASGSDAQGECIGEFVEGVVTPRQVAERAFDLAGMSTEPVNGGGGFSTAELNEMSLAADHLLLLSVFDLDNDGFDAVDLPNFLGAYDQNGDGKVGVEELTAFVTEAEIIAEAFRKADKDKSQHLTTGEIKSLMNGFGKVAEKLAHAETLAISLYDDNKDGELSEAEVNIYGASVDTDKNERLARLEVVGHVAKLYSQRNDVDSAITNAAYAARAAKAAAREKSELKKAPAPDATKSKRMNQAPTISRKSFEESQKEAKMIREDVERLQQRRRQKMTKNIPTPTGRLKAKRLAAMGKSGSEAVSKEDMRHFTKASTETGEKQAKQQNKQGGKQSPTVEPLEQRLNAAKMNFRILDMNQDNYLSQQELKALTRADESSQYRAVVTKIDDNQDGKLSNKEWTKHYEVLQTVYQGLHPDKHDVSEKSLQHRLVVGYSKQARRSFRTLHGGDKLVSQKELSILRTPNRNLLDFAKQYDFDGDQHLNEMEFIYAYPKMTMTANDVGTMSQESSGSCKTYEPPKLTPTERKAARRNIVQRLKENSNKK